MLDAVTTSLTTGNTVARLAFFKPNFAFLAFFKLVWLSKFLFGLILNFGFFLAFFSPKSIKNFFLHILVLHFLFQTK